MSTVRVFAGPVIHVTEQNLVEALQVRQAEVSWDRIERNLHIPN